MSKYAFSSRHAYRFEAQPDPYSLRETSGYIHLSERPCWDRNCSKQHCGCDDCCERFNAYMKSRDMEII